MKKIRLTESQLMYCIKHSINEDNDPQNDAIEVNAPEDASGNVNKAETEKVARAVANSTGKAVEMKQTFDRNGNEIEESYIKTTKKQLKEARRLKLQKESFRVK